jgi:hypothetical protein
MNSEGPGAPLGDPSQRSTTDKIVEVKFGDILSSLCTPLTAQGAARRNKLLIGRAQRIFLLWTAIHLHRRTTEDCEKIGLFHYKKTYFQARLFPMISIMNRVYKDKYAGGKMSLSQTLDDPVFLACLELLLKMDGLSRLRLLPQRSEFQGRLNTYAREARNIAKIVELSLRTNFDDLGDRQRPGITSTVECILMLAQDDEKEIVQYWGNMPPKRTALFDKWDQYERSSIFHWMISRGYFPDIPRLGSRDFPAYLLQSAGDHGVWAQMCANYRILWEDLRRRNYLGIPELQLAPSVSLPNPNVAPLEDLPETLREAVRNYSKNPPKTSSKSNR